MPVHGELVVGVALGTAAIGRPLGQDAHEKVHLVQRLDHRWSGGAGQQHVHECLAGFVRPPIRHGGHLLLKALQAVAVHSQLMGGSRPGQAQGSAGIGGISVGGQHRPALMHHHAGIQLHVVSAGTATQPATPLGGELGISQPGPYLVAAPGNRPGRARDGAHQLIGIGIVQRGGHPILLLEQKLVAGAIGGAMQLDPSSQDHLVVGPQLAAVGFVHLEHALFGPPKRMHVSQPSPPLLEVGLQFERHLTAAPMALGHSLGQ